MPFALKVSEFPCVDHDVVGQLPPRLLCIVFCLLVPTLLVAQPSAPVTIPQLSSIPSVLSRVKVSCAPESCRVYLDSVYRGRSPIVIDSVAPGPHTVWVFKVGYTSLETRFATHAGETAEILPRLLPSFGTLVLTSNQEGTRFFLDGKAIGDDAASDTAVVPTTYLLEARSGDRSAFTEISVTRDQRNIWRAALGVPSAGRAILGGLFPGTNQLSDASFLKGFLFLGAAVGSVAYLTMTDRAYRTAASAFDDAQATYLAARDEVTARTAHELMRVRHEALTDASRRAYVALGATVLVWALNLTDVILHHALKDTIRKISGMSSMQISTSRQAGETHVVLSYAF